MYATPQSDSIEYGMLRIGRGVYVEDCTSDRTVVKYLTDGMVEGFLKEPLLTVLLALMKLMNVSTHRYSIWVDEGRS